MDLLGLEFTPGNNECQAVRVETIHAVIMGQDVQFDSRMEGRIGKYGNAVRSINMSERSAAIAVERAGTNEGSEAAKEMAEYIARVRPEYKEAVMKALANVPVEVLVTTE